MSAVLSLATFAPELRAMVAHDRELRVMYLVARDRQRAALRARFGDDLLDRCLAGTAQLEACAAAHHHVGTWVDLDTRDHHFQHGANPEHQLVLSAEELARWPYADGPVGEWVARVHGLTNAGGYALARARRPRRR